MSLIHARSYAHSRPLATGCDRDSYVKLAHSCPHGPASRWPEESLEQPWLVVSLPHTAERRAHRYSHPEGGQHYPALQRKEEEQQHRKCSHVSSNLAEWCSSLRNQGKVVFKRSLYLKEISIYFSLVTGVRFTVGMCLEEKKYQGRCQSVRRLESSSKQYLRQVSNNS